VRSNQWLSVAVLGICLYIVWQIRSVLLLALTAITFAVIFNRAVRLLQRKIHSRGAAVLVLTGSVFLMAGVFGVIIVPAFIDQLQDLLGFAVQILDRVQTWLVRLGRVIPGFAIDDLRSLEAILAQLQAVDLELIIGRFLILFSNTLSIALNLLLVTVLIIMLLLNPTAYRGLLLRVLPSALRQQVSYVLDNCEEAIAGWSIGILFNMTTIALMSMVVLQILDIPLPFANGVLAGLLAFIPNLGPVISVIPPTAIALLEGPWKAIAVVVLYIVIQQVESNVLTPLVMKKQVYLLPAVALLSQIVFAILFGFLGLLLALPLTLMIQQWVNEFWVRGVLDQN